MAVTAGDVLVDTLVDWGVNVVFGIPGDGINGLIEALRRRQDEIRFVQVRHEESAAFMACSYAKFTGRLGVCVATSGPGGIHLLNGPYDAKLDAVPLSEITGFQLHDPLEAKSERLCGKLGQHRRLLGGRAHPENAADPACRTALAYRGVAHVTMP